MSDLQNYKITHLQCFKPLSLSYSLQSNTNESTFHADRGHLPCGVWSEWCSWSSTVCPSFWAWCEAKARKAVLWRSRRVKLSPPSIEHKGGASFPYLGNQEAGVECFLSMENYTVFCSIDIHWVRWRWSCYLIEEPGKTPEVVPDGKTRTRDLT